MTDDGEELALDWPDTVMVALHSLERNQATLRQLVAAQYSAMRIGMAIIIGAGMGVLALLFYAFFQLSSQINHQSSSVEDRVLESTKTEILVTVRDRVEYLEKRMEDRDSELHRSIEDLKRQLVVADDRIETVMHAIWNPNTSKNEWP